MPAPRRNVDVWVQILSGTIGVVVVVFVLGLPVVSGAPINLGRLLVSTAAGAAGAILILLLWRKRTRNGS